MKKHIILVAVVSILFGTAAFPQFKDYSLKLGLQGHYLIVANEYTEDEYNPSLLFRPHVAFPLSNILDLGIGLGFGWNTGEDYTKDKYLTYFYPLDVRLVVNPLRGMENLKVNPYVYLGGGLTYWDNTNLPANPVSAPDDNSGIAGIGVAGLGIEFALSENWLLDITGGFNIFGTDDINGDATNLQDKTLHDVDRYFNIGLGISYVFGDCHTDEDQDGIEKCDEEKLGTDPKNPDTDGDGLKDGEEINTYKTDPLNPDTDKDGLQDGAEVYQYKTDPLNPDTDGDGLLDGEEVTRYKTDPLNVDTDKDGLQDGAEVNTYKTDPLNPDTDGDTLPDGAEVNGTTLELRVANKPVESRLVKTDPLNPDTDGDGLKDGEELTRYFTDPLNVDTDAGSIQDGVEVNRKTDPLDPFDDVEKPEDGIKLTVEFVVGKADIRPEYFDRLERARQYMERNADRNFEIIGYTSTEGSESFNQKLSDKRAQSVVNWFVSHGIKAERLKATGKGECCPILVAGEEDRAASRRIILMTIEPGK
jgi:outer membrane protein OmpA-like peptidoglycan-associated protein/opacity protein-like surface antigen